MILKFVMRNDTDAVVTGTPTVTADGAALTPTATAYGWTVDAPLGSLVTCTLAGARTIDVLMPAADTPPAGYTRVTSATYGVLLAGTVVSAYLLTDTARATRIVEDVTVAANGTWYIDLPTGGSYVLVARLPLKDNVEQAVTT